MQGGDGQPQELVVYPARLGGKENMKKFILFLIVMAGAIAFSAFILMLIWNAFLVPVFGVVSLSFGMAILGWIFIYFVTALIVGAKSVVDFIQFQLTMHVAKQQMKSFFEKQGISGLMEHFGGMGFMGEQEDDKQDN